MEINSNLFSRFDKKRLTSKGKYPPGNESISQKKREVRGHGFQAMDSFFGGKRRCESTNV